MTKNKVPVRLTGQHFTIDKMLIKDSIKQANIHPNDTVLDIGAGKGFLTVHLLSKSNFVIAIENDFDLVRQLRIKFAKNKNATIVWCDFRKYTIPKYPFKVVSNIPYGITSEIFKTLMYDNLENFLGGSIILQLEPAKKICSKRTYNPYSVFYGTFYDLRLLYEINPESFMPPPKVKSALLKIERKKPPMNIGIKAKYLSFISFLLQRPELSARTALKLIFRKSQIRTISEKYGINMELQIVSLSPQQWKNCFLEMLDFVPDKFHPVSNQIISMKKRKQENKFPIIFT